jgi:hypothetical protein
MARFIIGCRLTRPGDDYQDLIGAVETLGAAWPCFPSAWVVDTHRSAAEIRDQLKPFIGANDDLLVAELTGEAAWHGAGPGFSAALKRVFAG